MQTIVGIVGLLTTLGLLWSRRTPLGFGSFATTLWALIRAWNALDLLAQRPGPSACEH